MEICESCGEEIPIGTGIMLVDRDEGHKQLYFCDMSCLQDYCDGNV
jgi:ribosomal protein L24E